MWKVYCDDLGCRQISFGKQSWPNISINANLNNTTIYCIMEYITYGTNNYQYGRHETYPNVVFHKCDPNIYQKERGKPISGKGEFLDGHDIYAYTMPYSIYTKLNSMGGSSTWYPSGITGKKRSVIIDFTRRCFWWKYRMIQIKLISWHDLTNCRLGLGQDRDDYSYSYIEF